MAPGQRVPVPGLVRGGIQTVARCQRQAADPFKESKQQAYGPPPPLSGAAVFKRAFNRNPLLQLGEA